MLQVASGSAAALNDRALSVAPVFISNADLRRRLGVSDMTLKRWRAAGSGPPYTRFGGNRIRYRLDDVLAYEMARTFASSADETASRAA